MGAAMTDSYLAMDGSSFIGDFTLWGEVRWDDAALFHPRIWWLVHSGWYSLYRPWRVR